MTTSTKLPGRRWLRAWVRAHARFAGHAHPEGVAYVAAIAIDLFRQGRTAEAAGMATAAALKGNSSGCRILERDHIDGLDTFGACPIGPGCPRCHRLQANFPRRSAN